MKRTMVAVALCVCFAAGAVAQAAELTFKIGISTNMDDPRAIAALAFKKEIEEKTGASSAPKSIPPASLAATRPL